jgi:putative restriction endonuclease
VRLFVAITDSDWFSYLSSLGPLDEVNFWQPSGSVDFKALLPGEPFLFKLHSPNDFIVGGGFFSHHSILPFSLAWSAFETKNGVRTQDEMRVRIEKYRRAPASPKEDYSIGCILLESPFFFDKSDWIPLPNWQKQIVRGKGFEAETGPGKSLWNRVESILHARHLVPQEEAALLSGKPKFGAPQTILPRLGQGSFRILITDVYRRTCAMSGSHVLHVLDAAHIKPYSKGGEHAVNNGLLLRQDLHTLFDRGYLTVTPEYKIEVSQRIKEEFNNGKEYYAMHGTKLGVPESIAFLPDSSLLKWHNERIFVDSNT